MPYILAAALICAIAFVAWRLVGASQPADVVPESRRASPRGPDDDPDFLRSLDS
ncbi:hypothetical protein [Gordonia spumicola]|uniref:hypothetical protein n=1 Tax=Gordonia spumicola TaxID=589161 RepID=UPI00164259D1|nr:hypothetical protein [Gordonia spumicola]